MYSYKTAIKRNKISAPMKKLAQDGWLQGRKLDYGCGRGDDCYFLNMTGYDPYFRPAMPVGQFDTITCNYVLNVIESPSERRDVIKSILSFLKPNGKAFISVRNDVDKLNGHTKIGTWQGHIQLNLPVLYRTANFITYVLEKS